jgi:uncharacterized protein DUF6335
MDKTEKLIDWREDEKKDTNRDGIDDRIEPPIPDIAAGSARLQRELRENPGADPAVTGGDPDARWEGAQFSGDESPVSSMPTPDQNDVDKLGQAMGVTYASDEELKVGEKEESRDKHRWELDPASSEDYRDRVRDEE